MTMRVGLLIGADQIGGAERQAWLLCEGLRESGIDVAMIAMARPRRRAASRRMSFPVPVTALWHGRGRGWLSRRRLAAVASRRDLELLLLYNLEAMALGASALTAQALVGSVRGILFSADEGVRGRLQGACRAMARVTCNCEATRKLLVEHEVCDEGKIVVIPNAVDEAHSSAAVVEHRPPSVLFAGSLKAVKDPLTFMRGALALLHHHPDARFTVVGDGALRGEMEAMAAREARASSFDFRGYVASEEIPFDEANIVVSTSIREASSNAILEALAHGIPVIATRVGGTVELVERSRGGTLIDPGDASGLTAAMRDLADAPDRSATLGENGRRYVREHHHPRKTLEQHVELFRSVLEETRA